MLSAKLKNFKTYCQTNFFTVFLNFQKKYKCFNALKCCCNQVTNQSRQRINCTFVPGTTFYLPYQLIVSALIGHT